MFFSKTFLNQIGSLTILLGLLIAYTACTSKKSLDEDTSLAMPRSTPESQGVDSRGIVKLLDAISESEIEFHSLMILRHGKVIAEGWWSPYKPEYDHSLYSLSKSFTSTAVGMALADGLFTVEDPVLSLFPSDYAPEEISENLAAMKVKHLLTMSTGHSKGTMYFMYSQPEGVWAKGFLAQPVEFEPGIYFLYNTGATFMLSAIVQRKTGQKLFDYLSPRLFEPLGIEGADWEENPEGINVGGYGLRVRTEDIAKLGQLYLQKGLWNGEQILSEAWVRDATSKQVQSRPGNPEDDVNVSDWAMGYGYQFWRNRPGGFRADGAMGQFSIVFPEKDVVIAVTSESSDMQVSMNLLWDHLLPAIKDAPSLPADPDVQKRLINRLQALSLDLPKSVQNSQLEESINNKVYLLEENEYGIESLHLNFTDDLCEVNMQHEHGDYQVGCSMTGWNDDNERSALFSIDTSVFRQFVPSRLAAYAFWKNENTLLLDWVYVETAHNELIQLVFEDDGVKVSFMDSAQGVLEESKRKPGMKGKMEDSTSK